MKLKIALAIVLMAELAQAYEIKENPDRKISIGFNFDRYSLKGDYELLNLKLPDFGNLTQNNFRGDLRIPMASFLTFSIGGGDTTQDLGLGVIDKDERWKMKGYNLNAGVRLYLP